MLSRIENAYLYILRVLVLIAATLALIGAVFGIVRSAPALAALMAPRTAPVVVPGGTFGDFVSEKRLEGVASQSAASSDTKDNIPKSIKSAVQSISNYDQSRLGQTLDKDSAIQMFIGNMTSFPPQMQDSYGESVASLMNQLQHSTGKPLSIDQINQLVQWHLEKYKVAIDQEAMQERTAQVETMQSLTVVAVGTAIFVVVIFFFLIVKIERNLRIVRTEAVHPAQLADAT